MAVRYGVPYKGSKNQIAEWIVSQFPKRKNFYDLFAGGCAVTHRAMLTNKFENFVINDISDVPSLFLGAVNGKYAEEKRWISREDFYSLKGKDPYIRYCWSFGNNGKDYLYSKEIEPWKKALHYARLFNDFSLLKEFGIKTDRADSMTVKKNADEWKKKYIGWAKIHFRFTEEEIEKYDQYKKEGIFENLVPGSVGLQQLKKRLKSLESLESLQSLQSLQRLQSLESLESLESLQSFQGSYEDITIKPASVIYCDIPYRNTDGYGEGCFDYERFYNWCEKQTEPLYISEYRMPPDRFECVASVEKSVTLCNGSDKKAVEKLFVPKAQIKRKIAEIKKEPVQLELF